MKYTHHWWSFIIVMAEEGRKYAGYKYRHLENRREVIPVMRNDETGEVQTESGNRTNNRTLEIAVQDGIERSIRQAITANESVIEQCSMEPEEINGTINSFIRSD